MMRFSTALVTFMAVSSACEAQKDKEDHGLLRSLTGNQNQGVCNQLPNWNGVTQELLFHLDDGDAVLAGLAQYKDGLLIGSNTALIPEACEASANNCNAIIADGTSGNTDFPHGNIKALATVGEMSGCQESKGELVVGVPDGMGAYLIDDHTVRAIVQSESYGPIRDGESYPYFVNNGAASFTGSHVQYVDYDREMLTTFMNENYPASDMVTGFGEVIEKIYNLKGEPVGPRNGDSPTEVGAHYGNCDADGNYVVADGSTGELAYPSTADWLMQSLCSAHLEERHQWGNGVGVEDDLFMTNEEWITYVDGSMFVGIGAFTIDLAQSTAWATGVFGQSGFEKIVEFNSQHRDYVAFAVSGYNGDFSGNSAVLQARNDEYGPRPDGSDYVWTENIVPVRIFAKGSNANNNDFLARNGLRYGKLYGFAVDMSNNGPTKGLWRDEFHKQPNLAYNGAKVGGKWIATEWTWDGTVRNFQHDVAWEFQIPPPMDNRRELRGGNNYAWWSGNGNNAPGEKTEHVTPDPREGQSSFIQGSTAGYFGQYYVLGLPNALKNGIPDHLDGVYYVYQGELDVTDQIRLGGKGQYPNGLDARMNYAGDVDEPTVTATFEDIDGLEAFEDNHGNLRVIIQEDSGNIYGERMFITSPLEHDDDGKELTYYFVAMSGGQANARIGVGIPEGSAGPPNANEFSGAFDMSGLLRKNNNGQFALKASDNGYQKRKNDARVSINDKYIMLGLQAHHMRAGVIDTFNADRGGHWLCYQPDIPQN